jgi:alkaline phosphatase
LKQLRISSQGTVSDLNLIKSANKSLALGVATDAESIGTLLEIARLKGKAFGLTTTEAFNDIVTGL